MTSLFRRSSSNGGSRGGSSAQELNNSRPARQVRRLEFNQAMEDFKTMFPNMDYDIIECVLRANNGAVDATIDQLLQMNLDGSGCDDSSDSEDSIPPEVTAWAPLRGLCLPQLGTSVSSCLLLPGHGAAQLLQAGRGWSARIGWAAAPKVGLGSASGSGQVFSLLSLTPKPNRDPSAAVRETPRGCVHQG